ncbi:hypothetical protein MXB_3956 [Myxobolus squamalis]|nr:hypothetical protein MXB_3956 [Myxobolus squamalis]
MCSKKEQLSMPRKRDFRQRAHNNPLTDNTFNHPESPDHLSLSEVYPKFRLINEKVEFLDIGCGEKYSEKLMMGMEIRSKVHEYTVQKKSDYIVQNLHNLTDEGINVEREGGKTFKAIYQRVNASQTTSPLLTR